MTAEEAMFDESFDLLECGACLQCGAAIPKDYRRMHLEWHAFITEVDSALNGLFTLYKIVEGRISLAEPPK